MVDVDELDELDELVSLLVVVVDESSELVSLLVVVVVDEVSELVGELIVIVVIVVSESEGAGQERSGRSSCRFTLEEAAPQPPRELPGCRFPMKELLEIWKERVNGSVAILTSDHYGSVRRRRVARIRTNRCIVTLDVRAEEEELLHRPCDQTGWPVCIELLQREEVGCHSRNSGRGHGCPRNRLERGIVVDAGAQHITGWCIDGDGPAEAKVRVRQFEQRAVLLDASNGYEAVVSRTEDLRRVLMQTIRCVVARRNNDGNVFLLGKGDSLIHDELV